MDRLTFNVFKNEKTYFRSTDKKIAINIVDSTEITDFTACFR